MNLVKNNSIDYGMSVVEESDFIGDIESSFLKYAEKAAIDLGFTLKTSFKDDRVYLSLNKEDDEKQFWSRYFLLKNEQHQKLADSVVEYLHSNLDADDETIEAFNIIFSKVKGRFNEKTTYLIYWIQVKEDSGVFVALLKENTFIYKDIISTLKTFFDEDFLSLLLESFKENVLSNLIEKDLSKKGSYFGAFIVDTDKDVDE